MFFKAKEMKNIDLRKIFFTFADVGTKVRPGYGVHGELLKVFSSAALKRISFYSRTLFKMDKSVPSWFYIVLDL